MPYQAEAIIVLNMWREVERRLEAVHPDSPEADELRADAARLRDEYQRLVAAALEHHRPVPPAFPEEGAGS